jgi:integrase
MRGHVRQRGRSWSIVIDVRTETGERKRRWFSHKGTKRTAEIECARLISELQNGAAVNPSHESVAGFLDRYLQNWVAVNVSARTAERYRQLLDHVRRHLGGRPLQKLRSDELAGLYATLSRSGLAARTVQHIHNVIFQALGQAKAWKLIRDNVAEGAKPPPVPDQELPILQPDRAREMLDALRGKPFYLLASLALATGLRRNEMLGLRWCDLDLDAGRLRVEQALEETQTFGVRTKGPKSRNGRRTIALPASTVAELRAHWRSQQEQRLAAGLGKAPDNAPVFAELDGRFLRPNAITKAWPRAMAAIGCPEITLHSLRHTHASMLIASGMDILTISRRLGHGSPTITLRVYGHLIHGTDDRAAQIIEQAFGSKMVADGGKRPEKPR